ncbi:MAG: nucleotidyltransferase family protein [Candidatus Thorarchaeota archaeon]|jgi:glucose-1-phosphate thymidylyltransferase
MKAVILAGGFAKRLGELGERTPKALLPVAGRPIIEHILGKISELGDEVSGIFVSTNKRFEEDFREWLSGLPEKYKELNIELVVEPVMEEGQKLGSIGALEYLIKNKGVDEDLLSVSGDNLFESGLNGLVEFHRERDTFVNGVFNLGSIDKVAHKFGVVLIDQNSQIMDFEEKPERPKSTLISTGIYIFPKNDLSLIKQYIDEGQSPDRLGDLLVWMMKKRTLHAFTFDGRWFDIGSKETYEEAQREYGNGK